MRCLYCFPVVFIAADCSGGPQSRRSRRAGRVVIPRRHAVKKTLAYANAGDGMSYQPEAPTPYAAVARGQAPGPFSPAVGGYNSAISSLEPPTPYATIVRGQAPGLFTPAAGSYNSVSSFQQIHPEQPTRYTAVAPQQPPGFFTRVAGSQSSSALALQRSHSSVDSRSHAPSDAMLPHRIQGHAEASLSTAALKPVNYARVETTFLMEEAKAKLLSLYQQEESLGVHLEAKRHALLHLKSEIARTDQLIREFERKRAFDLQQDANDRSLPAKDVEEVERLSQDILKEERIVSQLQALLEDTKNRKSAFQESLDRDRADRDDIKAALAKLAGKSPAAP